MPLENVIADKMLSELHSVLTIDHQTKEDNTVTIRYRDDMTQERIPLDAVCDLVRNKIL